MPWAYRPDLDATAVPWPALGLILCINMIHIAPWAACQGLLAEAGRQLPVGGQLVLYGPFVEQLVPTSPSNEAFDASLRSRDPQLGLAFAGAGVGLGGQPWVAAQRPLGHARQQPHRGVSAFWLTMPLHCTALT